MHFRTLRKFWGAFLFYDLIGGFIQKLWLRINYSCDNENNKYNIISNCEIMWASDGRNYIS